MLWVSTDLMLSTISWNVESGITNLSFNSLYIFCRDQKIQRNTFSSTKTRTQRKVVIYHQTLWSILYQVHIFAGSQTFDPHLFHSGINHSKISFFFFFFSNMCWKYCSSRILLFFDYMYFGICVHINYGNIFLYISPELKY